MPARNATPFSFLKPTDVQQTDPTEHEDLAKTQPARLQSMKAKLASLQAGAFSPSRGEPQMEAACSAAQSTCAAGSGGRGSSERENGIHCVTQPTHQLPSAVRFHLLAATQTYT